MISCKDIRLKIKEELISKINDINAELKLVVFQIGNDSASDVYVENKRKLCEEMGISFIHKKYDEIEENELLKQIDICNNDKSITGVLLQLPLPNYIDEEKVIERIDPNKDVDGLTSFNMGKLICNEKSIIPCTALGIMKIFEYNKIDLSSKNVVIIGRSKLVGLPLIHLFLKNNSTVNICHSKTKNLKEITKNADVVVVAIGNKQFIKEDYIKEDAIVIDVGINRDNNLLYGDCDYESIKSKALYITPVPGGVGVLTTIMLINNLVEAYLLQNNG